MPEGARPLTAAVGRRMWILTVAAAACAGMLSVISAWLRHLRSGLGCTPWPDCYGTSIPPLPPAWGQLSHRILATAAAVLVATVVAAAIRRRRHRLAAITAAAAVVALALLGPISAGPDRAAVILGNLLGGWVLVGALTWMALPPGRTDPPLRHLALLAAGLSIALAASGALIGVWKGLAGCTELLSCGPDPGPGHAAHLVHRGLAVALAATVVAVAVQLRRDRPALALALGTALLTQALTGPALAWLTPSPGLATLHGLAGLLLFLALLATLRSRAARVPAA